MASSASEKNGLSSVFNSKVAWGIAKYALTMAFGFAVGGVIDFTFFHDHPAGAELLKEFREPLLSFYDSTAQFLGFPELTRAAAKVKNMENIAADLANSAISGVTGGASDAASAISNVADIPLSPSYY